MFNDYLNSFFHPISLTQTSTVDYSCLLSHLFFNVSKARLTVFRDMHMNLIIHQFPDLKPPEAIQEWTFHPRWN